VQATTRTAQHDLERFSAAFDIPLMSPFLTTRETFHCESTQLQDSLLHTFLRQSSNHILTQAVIHASKRCEIQGIGSGDLKSSRIKGPDGNSESLITNQSYHSRRCTFSMAIPWNLPHVGQFPFIQIKSDPSAQLPYIGQFRLLNRAFQWNASCQSDCPLKRFTAFLFCRFITLNGSDDIMFA
jgi:hypothetical protein